MAKTLRVGVAGLGSIGEYHVRSFRQVPDVEVVAVAEIDKKTAEARGEEFDIPLRYGDWRKMLKEAGLDAITICLPNYLHCPVTLEALKTGLHVMVEKPPAMNLAEAKQMVAVARRTKKVLMVALCYRFSAAVQAAKELAASGALGKVYHARVKAVRRRGVPGLGGWFTSRRRGGGGPLLDIGVHVMDSALYLMNFPKPTHASGASYRKFGQRKDYTCTGMWGTPVPSGRFEVEDYVSAFVRFNDSVTMTVEASWASEIKPELKIEVLGDKGGVRIVPTGTPELTLYSQHGNAIVEEVPELRKVDSYAAEAAHFIECVRRRKRPITDIETALPVQTIIDGIYKSAKLSKEVRL